MQQLTRLDLSGVYDAARLTQLQAAQLLQLKLFVGGGYDPMTEFNPHDGQQLPLGHLTSVTLLDCGNNIVSGTELPPQLRVLHAGNCTSTEPLLPLQHLTELRLWETTTPYYELTQLRRLTNLSSIALRYAWDVNMFDAAEAFGQLPALKSLEIGDEGGDGGLPAEYVLHHLAQAAQLTRLVIKNPDFVDVTAEQLADVIKQLTRLQVLVLRDRSKM
ncbi:hypothetical protein OEZ86_008809 [Tetradesmus obliquus]|nr:hypothetical protein OEZ86_008809 [Tetradesmus obliquus]